MFTFLVAFTAMCYDHTTTGAIVVTSVSWAAISVLGLWFWWMSWDSTTNRWTSTCQHIYTTMQNWRPFASFKMVNFEWWDPLVRRAASADTVKESLDAKLESGTAGGDGSSVASRIMSLRSLQLPEAAHIPAMTLRKTSSRGSY